MTNNREFRLKKIVAPIMKELPFIYFFMKLMGAMRISQDMDSILIVTGEPKGYYILIGNFLIIFLYAYIGASIISSIRHKHCKYICKTLFYIIAISLFAITYFLQKNFNITISPLCFALIAETTSNESTEFINQYILSSTIVPIIKTTAFYAISIIIAEFVWTTIKRRLQNIKQLIPLIVIRFFSTIVTVILFVSGVYAIYTIYKIGNATSPDNIRYMQPPKDPISSICTSIVTLNLLEQEIVQAVSLNKFCSKDSDAYITQQDSLNIVVVIGESYIKEHSQLYGYTLKTTPHLKREKDEGRLFVFDDVISSSNSTSIVLRNILSCNNSSDNELWYKYPLFLTIFKQAGYNVCFWSNQVNFEQTAAYSFTLNSFLYNPEIQEIAYTTNNNVSYEFDGQLIDAYKQEFKAPKAKMNLILFHLLGQHHSASLRFPQDKFKFFNSDSIKRYESYIGYKEKEYIADYDNATLYNDYVLNEIINIFKNSNTILLYLSDHGEEVYDYRNQAARDHGPLTPNKLRYQFDIPFMLWCSDTYMAKNPDIIDNIKGATDRPYISDNICNILFNVAGIKTPYYRDSLDILSPNFRYKKRFINNVKYEDMRFKEH